MFQLPLGADADANYPQKWRLCRHVLLSEVTSIEPVTRRGEPCKAEFSCCKGALNLCCGLYRPRYFYAQASRYMTSNKLLLSFSVLMFGWAVRHIGCSVLDSKGSSALLGCHLQGTSPLDSRDLQPRQAASCKGQAPLIPGIFGSARLF